MSKELKSWLLLVLLALVWGSSFILMKKGMYTSDGVDIFSDRQVASLRMVIAGLVLFPFAARSFVKLKDFKTLLFLMIVGLCGNFFPAYLFTYAVTGVSSGLTGMMNSFVPVFALSIGFLFFKERLTKVQLIGVFIGVVGVILLMFAGSNIEMKGDWTHLTAIVMATLCYAVSVNVIKYKLKHLKSVELAALAFLLILVPSAIIGYSEGTVGVILNNDFAFQGLFYISILSVLGTAIALIFFNHLISISSVLFATSVTYLIPIVAAVIGFYHGEKLSLFQVVSVFVVLSGVFVANYLGKIKK